MYFRNIILYSCVTNLNLFPLQSANDPSLMKRRLWRYLLPVLFTSIAINVTKFFELEMLTKSNGDISYIVSDMRKNAIYSGITNWMRMIFMSILPLVIIVFFNFKVYNDVKERSQRSFERKSVKIVSSTKVKTIIILGHLLGPHLSSSSKNIGN